MKIIDNIYLYSTGQSFDAGQKYHLKIQNGRIESINEGKVSKENADTIDGEGHVLMPSFNDSHLHLLRYGLMKNELDLREAESWQNAKKMIEKQISTQKIKESNWIVARGLTDHTYDDIAGLAVADHLDEIESDHPMFILHRDGHECVINTPALKKVKQNEDLADNHSEFIEKDINGEWTGRFKDTAVHFIKFHFRCKSKEEIDSALQSALPHLARWGITSVQTDDLNYAGTYSKVWKSYRLLEKKGMLSLRTYLHHYIFGKYDMKYFLEHSDKRTGDGSDKVRVGAFKIFVDGTFRLHTAALQESYNDWPDTRGILNYSQEDMNAMLQIAEDHNMQVAMHCIGDRAVKSALKAIQSAGNSMRHRIIHAQMLSDELLDIMQNVKPCVETQPGFLLDEWDQYAKWLGESRESYCGIGKSLQKAGLNFTLSSDAPIAPLNPFEQIFAALNRTDYDGHPEGGWMPHERLDIDEALQRYTSTPARLEFMEGQKGQIKEGALADFILLNHHPHEISPQKFHETKIQQTWIAGNKIFDRAQE